MPMTAQVTHSVPGRIRLRIRDGSPRQTAGVLEALVGLEGHAEVAGVSTDPRIGSALVTYDPEVLDAASALKLISKAHEVFADVAAPEVVAQVDKSASEAAQLIRRRLTRADRRVLEATDGAIDLRVLIPIGLAGLSARQLVRQGPGLKSMPWYVLAYYAFDSFIKLHGQPGSPDMEAGGSRR